MFVTIIKTLYQITIIKSGTSLRLGSAMHNMGHLYYFYTRVLAPRDVSCATPSFTQFLFTLLFSPHLYMRHCKCFAWSSVRKCFTRIEVSKDIFNK